MRKKLLPLGRLFESAWYNPILKAVPMSMGILMSGNAGYAIAGNMSDNVVIVQQQTISVTGTVIDASGEPLVGVNIVEAGTVNGVISDFEGKFTLNVKPNATLKISYIGYIAQNILVKGQKNLTIGEFYQFNLSSCIRQQNSLTAQFVSFSLSNLANIFYPPQFLQ